MRAVNLMPAERARRSLSTNTGLPFIGAMLGLTVVLAGVVMLVLAHNTVSSRQARLASITAQTARWTSAAQSYSGDVATADQRAMTIGAIETLAGQRADWATLLDQLAREMPTRSKLTTLTTSSAAPATAAATSSAAGSAAAVAAPQSSSISLAGCAASQSVLAQTMINLRHVSGVSQVTLGSSSTGASGGGGCPYRTSYTLSLTFVPPTDAPATATASTSTATPSTATAAPSTTTASGVSQ